MTELTRRSVIAGAAVGAATAMSPIATSVPANAAAPLRASKPPAGIATRSAIMKSPSSPTASTGSPSCRTISSPMPRRTRSMRRWRPRSCTGGRLRHSLFADRGEYRQQARSCSIPARARPISPTARARRDNSTAISPPPASMPKAVDTVIISHYHGDHVNGLVIADGTPAFPNAEILVPAAEHKYWMDDGEMSRAPAGRMEGLFKNNRRVFSGDVVKQGDALRGRQGNRAGHHRRSRRRDIRPVTPHTSFRPAGKTLFVQADVTNVPFLFARNPGWHAASIRTARWPRRPAARPTTCCRPTRRWCRASTIRSRPWLYRETASGYRENMVPWNPTI